MKVLLLILLVLCCCLPACFNADKAPDKKATLNSLEILRNKETIAVTYSSWGCFGGNQQRLVITKMDAQYQARLYELQPRKVRFYLMKKTELIPVPLTEPILLTASQAESFLKFEKELKQKRSGGCTTVDHYSLKSNYRSIEATDGSCQWNGFTNLCESYFGKL